MFTNNKKPAYVILRNQPGVELSTPKKTSRLKINLFALEDKPTPTVEELMFDEAYTSAVNPEVLTNSLDEIQHWIDVLKKSRRKKHAIYLCRFVLGLLIVAPVVTLIKTNVVAWDGEDILHNFNATSSAHGNNSSCLQVYPDLLCEQLRNLTSVCEDIFNDYCDNVGVQNNWAYATLIIFLLMLLYCCISVCCITMHDPIYLLCDEEGDEVKNLLWEVGRLELINLGNLLDRYEIDVDDTTANSLLGALQDKADVIQGSLPFQPEVSGSRFSLFAFDFSRVVGYQKVERHEPSLELMTDSEEEEDDDLELGAEQFADLENEEKQEGEGLGLRFSYM